MSAEQADAKQRERLIGIEWLLDNPILGFIGAITCTRIVFADGLWRHRYASLRDFLAARRQTSHYARLSDADVEDVLSRRVRFGTDEKEREFDELFEFTVENLDAEASPQTNLRLLDAIYEAEHGRGRPSRKRTERQFERAIEDDVARELADRGERVRRQVQCDVGFADIVTDTAVYEVKAILDRKSLFSAISQVQLYRLAIDPDLRMVIVGPVLDDVEPIIAMLPDLGVEVWRWGSSVSRKVTLIQPGGDGARQG